MYVCNICLSCFPDMGEEITGQLKAENIRHSIIKREIRPQEKECLTLFNHNYEM